MDVDTAQMTYQDVKDDAVVGGGAGDVDVRLEIYQHRTLSG